MPTAIIYGTKSKSDRRLVIADSEGACLAELRPGESIILIRPEAPPPLGIKAWEGREDELFYVIDAGKVPNLYCMREVIEEVTGVKPQDTRCVVLVPKGEDMEVRVAIIADPVLDAHPEGFVVREPEAVPGDTLKSDGEFYRDLDGEAVKITEYAAAARAKEEARADAPAEMTVL